MVIAGFENPPAREDVDKIGDDIIEQPRHDEDQYARDQVFRIRRHDYLTDPLFANRSLYFAGGLLTDY